MKKAALAGLFLGIAASAGPFRSPDVPAEAEWWLHLDLEQLKATQVGACLMDLLSAEEPQRKWEAFRAVFGFDPRRDLHGITLGGAGPQVAVILRGRFDTERLTALPRAGDGYEAVVEGTRTLHSWIYGAFHGHAAEREERSERRSGSGGVGGWTTARQP